MADEPVDVEGTEQNSDVAAAADDGGSQTVSENADGASEEEAGSSGSDEGKEEAGKEEDKSDDKSSEKKASDEDKSKEEKSDEEKSGAPDAYEPFTLPEEYQIDVEQEEAFGNYVKERNLSQADAQGLVDLHVEGIEKVLEGQQERWNEVKAGWAEETKQDKDLLDADGNVEPAIATAKKAVLRLGGEAMQEALDFTGAGSHPSVVKAFFKLGKLLEEDTSIVFGGAKADTRTAAQKMYPTMK